MANTNGTQEPRIDEKLLRILACPACRASVEELDAALVCSRCGRRYPIRDGIPVMLLDEAVLPEGGDECGPPGEPPDAPQETS